MKIPKRRYWVYPRVRGTAMGRGAVVVVVVTFDRTLSTFHISVRVFFFFCLFFLTQPWRDLGGRTLLFWYCIYHIHLYLYLGAAF
ncbi:hypothetical protein F4775DRAFT_548827 [Biscogniauxia sp. FL1348]|nr:hypothetical protein F4775DRAFT_548827 [Biscogniauxia sp. FL1348]